MACAGSVTARSSAANPGAAIRSVTRAPSGVTAIVTTTHRLRYWSSVVPASPAVCTTAPRTGAPVGVDHHAGQGGRWLGASAAQSTKAAIIAVPPFFVGLATNRYPTPRTVSRCCGRAGSFSRYRRSRTTKLSMARVSVSSRKLPHVFEHGLARHGLALVLDQVRSRLASISVSLQHAVADGQLQRVEIDRPSR